MHLKVIALIENKPAFRESSDPGKAILCSEHGLSLFVESQGNRVLFDSGASSLLVQNADALGLGKAIANLDAIVLSHGHYDHTGGLAEILKRSKDKVPVHIRPGFFRRRFRRRASKHKKIGVPYAKQELENLGARLIIEQGPNQIRPGFYVAGKIGRKESWEDIDPDLYIENKNKEIVPDLFDEELTLVAGTEKGLVIFVGCAHRGLLNSIAAAKKATGDSRVRALVGGAHLKAASHERIQRTVHALARLNAERIVLGHCTGEKAEQCFAKTLGNRFSCLRAGASWILS
jgi:7,8-dihydropterin-6-yl-methyl-4-(beta-D-ribofuranosyl)aminobenzene 5'-phosphate synthase